MRIICTSTFQNGNFDWVFAAVCVPAKLNRESSGKFYPSCTILNIFRRTPSIWVHKYTVQLSDCPSRYNTTTTTKKYNGHKKKWWHDERSLRMPTPSIQSYPAVCCWWTCPARRQSTTLGSLFCKGQRGRAPMCLATSMAEKRSTTCCQHFRRPLSRHFQRDTLSLHLARPPPMSWRELEGLTLNGASWLVTCLSLSTAPLLWSAAGPFTRTAWKPVHVPAMATPCHQPMWNLSQSGSFYKDPAKQIARHILMCCGFCGFRSWPCKSKRGVPQRGCGSWKSRSPWRPKPICRTGLLSWIAFTFSCRPLQHTTGTWTPLLALLLPASASAFTLAWWKGSVNSWASAFVMPVKSGNCSSLRLVMYMYNKCCILSSWPMGAGAIYWRLLFNFAIQWNHFFLC